jgi:polyphosphate glucokinase
MARQMLGIDIGGSGIKGAPVDLSTGAFTRERFRIDTPQPSRPKAVAAVLAEIVDHFAWDGPVGVTYPGVVIDGVALSAANVSKRWIGLDAASLIAKATGREITLLNDADAAGIAEMRLGAGRGRRGTVVLLTLGTGIGSALFTDGVLVPNTEFGHLQIQGEDAEVRASAKARTDHDLSWEKWAKRLGTYMRHLEALISPSLIIVGGGVSRRSEHFVPLIDGVRAEIVPARLVNNAGIVGAAMAASAAHPAHPAETAETGEPAPAKVRAAGTTGAGRRGPRVRTP